MAFGTNTPGGALDAMQSGSPQQGFDPNQDPYNLQEAGQQLGAQQQQMNQMPQPAQQPDIPHPDQGDQNTRLRGYIEAVNIAEKLDEELLKKIAIEASEGFERDLESRQEWERKIDEYTKLAQQIQEQKAYPWPKASNVKYPLLSTAAMQFAARAYPTLVPSDGQLVLGQVIGKDPDDSKQNQAERISTY